MLANLEDELANVDVSWNEVLLLIEVRNIALGCLLDNYRNSFRVLGADALGDLLSFICEDEQPE